MMQQSESLVDENPYVQILYKKIRALRKKMEKIVRCEQMLKEGKEINAEQKELLSNKGQVELLLNNFEGVYKQFREVSPNSSSKAISSEAETNTNVPSMTTSSSQSEEASSPTEPVIDDSSVANIDDLLHRMLKFFHVYSKYSSATGKELPPHIDYFGKALLGQTSLQAFGDALSDSLRMANMYLDDGLASENEIISGMSYRSLGDAIEELATTLIGPNPESSVQIVEIAPVTESEIAAAVEEVAEICEALEEIQLAAELIENIQEATEVAEKAGRKNRRMPNRPRSNGDSNKRSSKSRGEGEKKDGTEGENTSEPSAKVARGTRADGTSAPVFGEGVHEKKGYKERRGPRPERRAGAQSTATETSEVSEVPKEGSEKTFKQRPRKFNNENSNNQSNNGNADGKPARERSPRSNNNKGSTATPTSNGGNGEQQSGEKKRDNNRRPRPNRPANNSSPTSPATSSTEAPKPSKPTFSSVTSAGANNKQ